MLEHALRAGEALNAAKDEVGHGGWLIWLAQNFEASEDIAELYMRMAKNSEHIRNLPLEEASLRGALNSLRAHRPKTKPDADAEGEDMPNLSPARRKVHDAADKLADLVGDKEALEQIKGCIERAERFQSAS
jgi:hypothetical protein